MTRSVCTHSLLIVLPLTIGCGFGMTKLGDTGNDGTPGFEGWGDGGAADDDDDGSPGGGDGGGDGPADTPGEDPPDDDPPDDDPPDDDPPEDELTILSISPQHGTNLGGTLVSIMGGPFSSGTVVKIGGLSVPVAANLGDELRVETPAFDGEGWASVTVIEPEGASGEWADGFRFWQDGTGLTGATGFYEWVQPVGGYWEDGTPPDPWGSALIHFIVPHDFHWWDLVSTTLGTCLSSEDASYSGDLYVYDLGESALVIANEIGTNTVMHYDPERFGFQKAELARSDFTLDHSYDMKPFEGSDAPRNAIAGFIETPASFSVTSPSIEGPYVPYIYRSQTITWESGGADVVWIELTLTNSTGTAAEQTVVCTTSDTGSFSVPSYVWTSWPTGRQVNLRVSKITESSALLPHNNSEARISSFYSVLGAGFSQ